MKNVLIYFTSGASGKTITTQARTWEGLQKDLSENDIQFSNMKAVVGESRVTLESPMAELPQGDFTLFLMPKKTKSGIDYLNMPYKDCRKTIKECIETADDKDAAKKFFGDGKKNYTQTSTDYMRNRLVAWFKQASKTVKETVTKKSEKVVEKVEAVVESVKESKTEKVVEEVVPMGAGFKTANECIDFVKSTIDSADKDGLFGDLTPEEQEGIKDINALIEEVSDEIKERLAKEAEIKAAQKLREEKKAGLDSEARKLSREFSDLRNL
jgi:hypothetical protein